ncbi:hypothetical protein ARMGADRAFT_1037002 [Armillaria gallica]|uniref:Uncharacterized protein n=1 Tax=Armillaria gallica TaxID=47427 RepID=A0A2H3D144_ARMGA|nr:hypothetical protein ARMGADRAFT_1037002 [Armillaria gallica]
MVWQWPFMICYRIQYFKPKYWIFHAVWSLLMFKDVHHTITDMTIDHIKIISHNSFTVTANDCHQNYGTVNVISILWSVYGHFADDNGYLVPKAIVYSDVLLGE